MLHTLESDPLSAAARSILDLAASSSGPWNPEDSAELRTVHETFCGALKVPADSAGELWVERREMGRGGPEEVRAGDLGAGILFLTEPVGGAARFPKLRPARSVDARVGRAVVWPVSPTDETESIVTGSIGPCVSAPVSAGERVVLRWRLLPAGRLDRQFVCLVERHTPSTTIDLLEQACKRRGVPFRALRGAEVDPRTPPLEPGSLLYRTGAGSATCYAEALLYGPGVATFYRGDDGPFWAPVELELAFARAGLPVPRSAWIQSAEPTAVDALVDWLGGYPVVIRAPGGEGGVGVMRADGPESLYGILELLISRGERLRLSSFVPDAKHWRLVVVGDQIAASYLNPVRPNDFRSTPSLEASDYRQGAPEPLQELAVAASKVIGSEFAGVDLLEHPSGRLYLLEANFPCYFPQATEIAGLDIAGPMVDHLLTKADRTLRDHA